MWRPPLGSQDRHTFGGGPLVARTGGGVRSAGRSGDRALTSFRELIQGTVQASVHQREEDEGIVGSWGWSLDI